MIISLYLSLSRFKFVKGGFEIRFVGLANYKKLLAGSEQTHFLGVMADPSPLGWLMFVVGGALMAWALVHYLSSQKRSVAGLIGRVVAYVLGGLLVWVLASTLSPGGVPAQLL